MKQGIIISTVASLVFMAAGYASTTWVGRVLGPAGFGTYGLLVSIITLVNAVQITGIPQSVSKFTAEHESARFEILKSGLRLQLVLSLFFLVSTWIGADWISHFFRDPTIAPYVRITSLTFPIYGLYALYTGYHNGLHNFSRQAMMTIAYSAAKVGLILALTWVYQLPGAVIGFSISAVAGLVWGMVSPLKTTRSYPYRQLIRMSVPLVSFSLLSIGVLSIDLFLIKRLLPSAEAVGYYAANQNIARIPFYAFNGVLSVIFPMIVKSVSHHEPNTTKSMVRNILRSSILVLLLAVVLMAVTSSQLITLFYSSTFLPAAPSLSVLVIGTGLFTLLSVLCNIITGLGKPYAATLFMGISLIVTTVLCYVFIPAYQLVGAAAAVAVGSFIPLFGALLYIMSFYRFAVPRTMLLKGIGSAAVVGALLWFIHLPLWFLPLLYLFFTALYYVLLIVTKEYAVSDIKVWWDLFPFSFKRRQSREHV